MLVHKTKAIAEAHDKLYQSLQTGVCAVLKANDYNWANITILGSFGNKMRSHSDYVALFKHVEKFLVERVPANETLHFAGDFYVWKNTMKLLYGGVNADGSDAPVHRLRKRLIPVPDFLHIAINLQEAIFRFAFDLLQPMVTVALEDAEKIQLATVKQRPARRVALLTILLRAWLLVRQQILDLRQPFLNPAAGVIQSALRWLFDEEIPLSLDALGVFATGRRTDILQMLLQMLPVCIRLNKINYVSIVTFILGYIQHHPSADLTQFSSEDIEIFHSLLRATTSYHDTETQVCLQACYITANRSAACYKFLTARTEVEAQLRQAEQQRRGMGNLDLNPHLRRPRKATDEADDAVDHAFEFVVWDCGHLVEGGGSAERRCELCVDLHIAVASTTFSRFWTGLPKPWKET
ncbi:hypothetical protein HKX48_001347 [Thoreauomyces humboldtii]|nr:hypothetical protein HKX48_001347 [Thoreauomyces humboldtii]